MNSVFNFNPVAHEKRAWKILLCLPESYRNKLTDIAKDNSVSRNELIVQMIGAIIDSYK